jgi:hypothetical protein
MAPKYMYQHFPFRGPPKHSRIGIFGLKIYRLATLGATSGSDLIALTTKVIVVFLPTCDAQDFFSPDSKLSDSFQIWIKASVALEKISAA